MDESLASIILNSVQIPSFVCSGTMVIELREFNETKKNNVDKINAKIYNLAKKWKFGTLITDYF